ncbi:response regulator [Bdellovibrio bacteriovorus]|uniref:response regulator n=1 Tax=Bdellovibrio bacteriovorus TaxID=959 RepID=UPI00045C09F2|nr:response regulator [Bdellovibrio bacteriovorus]AHZ83789.1 chemotaxis protein [Bdellovibrio bacteriovorus]BEV69762.1 Chemotaxis protein CheY [Bdellovibrio bacteriovorus]
MTQPRSKCPTLVIDDNSTDRLILAAALDTLGFKNILEAEDGSIALGKIENAFDTLNPVQLIFLDWRMPKRDGAAVLQELKRSRKFKSAKVIMTTNVSDENSVKSALQEGVDDYIIKPVTLDLLRKKIESLGF